MNLEKIYKENFGVDSNGWGSKESQQLRFEIIKNIGIQPIHEVLDVGCGTGDLASFLYPNQFYRYNYTGIDLRNDIVARAQEEHPKFRYMNVPINLIEGMFDYVVASGIFCFREPNWKKKTTIILHKMLSKARKGVAVNFLRKDDTIRKDKLMFFTTPDVIVDIAISLTSEFTLRCDYKDNDMTLYLYP